MSKFKPTKILTLITGIAAVSIAYLGYKSTRSDEGNEKKSANENLTLLDSKIQEDVIKENESMPVATIKVKDFGEMKFILYPSIAPNTVNNFIDLCNKHFYDNLYFNRIIKDFIVQGGMNLSSKYYDSGYFIKDEISDLKHKTGVISMAKFLENNLSSCQFFILTSNSPELDGKFTPFGRIIEGLDVLEKLNNVKVNQDSAIPEKQILIESITVDSKGVNYPEPEKILY